MGVIKRQGIKQSLVVYAGMVIGMVNVLYIYPKFLTQDEFGLIRFLTETANLFAPFLLIGAQSVSIRFFPEFRDPDNSHHSFFWMLFILTSAGVGIGTGLYLYFQEDIFNYYAPRNILFERYFNSLWILVVLLAYNFFLRNYSVNYKRIVVPTLIHNYLLKLGSPLLVLGYFFQWISFDHLITGLIWIFIIDLVLQFLYLNKLKALGFGRLKKMLTRERLKRMVNFALFGLMGSLGYKLINYLDAFMVGTMVDLRSVAVYSIAFLIINVLRVPYHAILQITNPIISAAWHKHDRKEILNLYRRSSQLLLTVGMGLFLLIWVNVDHIYQLMPNGHSFIDGKEVILILGIAKVIDMSMGLNSTIIGYSKYYRFNFYSMSVLAVANIILNLLLIPKFGITGAALATLFSLSLFNLVRFGYNWWRFDMQPFNLKSLAVFMLGALLFALSYLLPNPFHPFFNVLWQSTLFALAFIAPVLWFKWCPDLNTTLVTGIRRFRALFVK